MHLDLAVLLSSSLISLGLGEMVKGQALVTAKHITYFIKLILFKYVGYASGMRNDGYIIIVYQMQNTLFLLYHKALAQSQ